MTLVQKNHRKKQTRVAVVTMKIFDNEGRERRRFFNYWTKYTPEQERSLIKFFRPKNVKGHHYLRRQNNQPISNHNGSIYLYF